MNPAALAAAGAFGAWLLWPRKSAAVVQTSPGQPTGSTSMSPGGTEKFDSGVTPAPFEGVLPPDSTPSREAAILGAVIDGKALAEWTEIVSHANGHKAVIPVMSRALRLPMPDGSLLRVSANYKTTQEIANQYGAAMLTSKVSDLIWQQASHKVMPVPSRPWQGPGTDNSGSKTHRMIQQSQLLDQQIPVEPSSVYLVANEGKDWVITARNWTDPSPAKRANGANFGWYPGGSKSPGGLSVVQSIGLMHDMSHVDYSQYVRLMGRSILIDDSHQMDVADVLRDPELAALISDEGPLPDVVHPKLASQPSGAFV